MREARYILPVTSLDRLFAELRANGRQIVGPTRRDGAIVYDHITTASELPVGWVDDQEAGSYALRDTGSARVFDFTVGPDPWKRFLRPPRQKLWTSERDGSEVTFLEEPLATQQQAFVGVRSCDLAALQVLDTVLTGQQFTDGRYARRRSDTLIVAVQCARAGGTCFCTSMNTGPRADSGFDLALTELELDEHFFVVEAGSDAGAELVAALGLETATDEHWTVALAVSESTASSMGRTLDTEGLADALRASLDDPHWERVAQRCLSCANCTMVCPTCFCTTTTIETDLRQTTATQSQVWDSCFNADFTYMHGGPVRKTVTSRYRQWLTHKLSSWHDQFGSSGCVGCGRCITWCPVGIDLTQEVARLRSGEV